MRIVASTVRSRIERSAVGEGEVDENGARKMKSTGVMKYQDKGEPGGFEGWMP